MKRYKVEVTELTYRRDFVIIEAESKEEAEDKATKMWEAGEFYFEDGQTEFVGEPELYFVDAEEIED